MNQISEKEKSTISTRFWTSITEKIASPFTEKVEEQVKWDDSWF